MNYQFFKVLCWLTFLLSDFIFSQANQYPWLESSFNQFRVKDIVLPDGFTRVAYPIGSFQDWLRHLPLKDSTEFVKLYNGSLKSNQQVHFRIIQLDVGKNNLQQCADAMIRLYAEYQYAQKRFDKIAFNFTSGHRAEFKTWSAGYRPQVKGNQVSWKKTAAVDSSDFSFRAYLNSVFMFAGSYSLSKELVAVNKLDNLDVGDVFIQPGFPGHAVMVVDLAKSSVGEEKIFLLVQSYMPAQEVHILKNPENPQLNPWYKLKEGKVLRTPEWTFKWTDLKRFK